MLSDSSVARDSRPNVINLPYQWSVNAECQLRCVYIVWHRAIPFKSDYCQLQSSNPRVVVSFFSFHLIRTNQLEIVIWLRLRRKSKESECTFIFHAHLNAAVLFCFCTPFVLMCGSHRFESAQSSPARPNLRSEWNVMQVIAFECGGHC